MEQLISHCSEFKYKKPSSILVPNWALYIFYTSPVGKTSRRRPAMVRQMHNAST